MRKKLLIFIWFVYFEYQFLELSNFVDVYLIELLEIELFDHLTVSTKCVYKSYI